MRFMVLVKATADSEAGKMPREELLMAMGKFNQSLIDAGVMEAGDGLKPSLHGARVCFRGGEVTYRKGPFRLTDEMISGFWIWKCDSLDEAIEWSKKSPFVDADLEIRTIFAMEDFGEDVAKLERAQREQLAGTEQGA